MSGQKGGASSKFGLGFEVFETGRWLLGVGAFQFCSMVLNFEYTACCSYHHYYYHLDICYKPKGSDSRSPEIPEENPIKGFRAEGCGFSGRDE